MDQLQRLMDLSTERAADDRLYNHMREHENTCASVLATLIGLDAVSDSAFERACEMTRMADERTANLRARTEQKDS